jgi:para-nitrobenzyl esterase
MKPARREFLRATGGGIAALWATGGGRRSIARAASESPVAMTRQGRVLGFVDSGISVFRGIPYGESTAGRRFMAPVPRAPWATVRPALDHGSAAPQSRSNEPTSEDCLVLNVWTPALDAGRRPVLVYIHGGGFTSGSGSSPLYSGVNLCRRGDVVVVTLNHRLNVFGYTFLRKLGAAKYADSGNVGQLDLILALRWVRDNIAAFGGDPTRVTVFGQSGGGAKIATLMAMPSARGLFQRAITMSGQQITAAGANVSTERARALLGALGLGPGAVDRLSEIPVAKLLEATTIRDPFLTRGSLYFGPVLDEVSLRRHPFFPDAPAAAADIPLLLGNARDETRNLIGGSHPEYFELGWDGLAQRITSELAGRTDIDGDLVVSEYRRIYPNYTPTEIFFAATTAGRSWRGQIIEAELRAAQQSPTWVYQVDFRSPRDGGKWRAAHMIDIPLAFDNTHVPDALTGDGDAARQMAASVSEAFIAFAKTGKPAHPAIPDWPPYRLDSRSTMIFDVPSRLARDPRGDERRLFAKAPYIQPGT